MAVYFRKDRGEAPMPLTTKADKPSRALLSFSKYFILIFLFVFIAFLSVESILRTCDMNTHNSASENIDYLYDNFLLNIAILILSVLLLYFVRKLLSKISTFKIVCIMTAWVLGFGVFWIISAQTSTGADSHFTTDAAQKIAFGDLSALSTDYFRYYPFQLGFVLFCEGLIRIFRLKDSLLLLEILNIFFLAAAYIANVILTGRLFHNKSVQKMAAFLFAICLPPIFFSSMIYGNIPGYMFSSYAVLCVVLYIQTHRKRYSFLAAFTMGAAVMIKMNYLILLIAIIIVLLLHGIQNKKLFDFISILMIVGVSLLLKEMPLWIYAWRSGFDFGNGIPMISWVAMGLHESPITSGWYHPLYTVHNFNRAGQNTQAAAKISWEIISERAIYFIHNIDYAREFFYQKTVSQWNEPTFQSLWISAVRGSYDTPNFFANICLSKQGQSVLKWMMGAYQQMILALSCVGILKSFRFKNPEILILPLSVIGGFLYHFFFEAKSQYILTYFLLLIPFAAYGSHYVLNNIEIRFHFYSQKRKNKKYFKKTEVENKK